MLCKCESVLSNMTSRWFCNEYHCCLSCVLQTQNLISGKFPSWPNHHSMIPLRVFTYNVHLWWKKENKHLDCRESWMRTQGMSLKTVSVRSWNKIVRLTTACTLYKKGLEWKYMVGQFKHWKMTMYKS